jgi:hypothetical protein
MLKKHLVPVPRDPPSTKTMTSAAHGAVFAVPASLPQCGFIGILPSILVVHRLVRSKA